MVTSVFLQVLREDHFGQLAVRQRLREVAMMVQDRIRRGVATPAGSATKALENLKIKIMALQLPPREADVPEPAVRLLAWAREEEAAEAAAGTSA